MSRETLNLLEWDAEERRYEADELADKHHTPAELAVIEDDQARRLDDMGVAINARSPSQITRMGLLTKGPAAGKGVFSR